MEPDAIPLINDSISLGLSYLHRQQADNGAFRTFVDASGDPALATDPVLDPSVFATTLIATSLLQIDTPLADSIIQKAARSLLKERQPGGAWKFWSVDHPGQSFIAADVDDTACIAHLLRFLSIPSNCNDSLLMHNRDPAGRFYTWIVPRLRHLSAPTTWPALVLLLRHPLRLRRWFLAGASRPRWHGLDVVVNANVLRYLGDRPQTAVASSWISDVVQHHQEAFSDQYYQSALALYYSLLGCAEHGVRSLDTLKPLVLARIEDLLKNSSSCDLSGQDMALALIVLSVWNPLMAMQSGCISRLLAMQRNDGAWPAQAFYYDDFNVSLRRSWGSTELTTAFCLEALARCKHLLIP